MNLEELRKYKISLDSNGGIAIFDLVSSFVGAYVLDYYFGLSNILTCRNKQQVYYLLVIPVGILVHHFMAHFQQNVLFPNEITFLNKRLFSYEMNIYKLIVLIILYLIYKNC